MSTAKKSFWSSLPGLITGVAGVVGAVVGLITVLINLGVIGGSNNSPTATTVPLGAPGGGGTTTGDRTTVTTLADGSFTVDPNALKFSLTTTKGAVTVLNTGSVPLKMNPPDVSGPDKDKFVVSASECTSSPLPPKKPCTIDVTFAGGLSAKATMTVSAKNAPDTVPIALSV